MTVWLAWLRGPLFWAALTFMVLGLARHVALTLGETVRVARRAGDKNFPYRRALSATARWLLPIRHAGARPLFAATSVLFHVAAILVPLFLAGHLALWREAIGLSWPALPNGVATGLTITAVVTAVALVVQRLAARDARALSRFGDYLLPLVVALPFATGFLVMHPAWNPFTRDLALLLHAATADLLLLLIPITKLRHMALLPGAQLVSELAWHFPPDAGERVGVQLGRASEPI
jgi:hypothetical protein